MRALFINDDKAELNTLTAAIDDHFDVPPAYESICGQFSDVGEQVLQFCAGWFAFVFIDPYGPGPTPFELVSKCVSQKYNDAMINFPYLSLQKWSGFLDLDSPNRDQEAKLAGVDAFMGGREWRSIALRSRHRGQDLETCLLRHYMDKLLGTGVKVVAIPLLFDDRERTKYHLVFTSHNVAGLARAKEVFIEGRRHQAYLRELRSFRGMKKRTKQNTFAFMEPQRPQGAPDLVDIVTLGEILHSSFVGGTVARETVILRGLQEPGVLVGHVNRALTHLKKQSRVAWSRPGYRAQVSFLEAE